MLQSLKLNGRQRPQYLQLLIADIAIAAITPLIALGLRFDDWQTVVRYGPVVAVLAGLFMGTKLITLHAFGLYRHYWRYASINEVTELTLATLNAIFWQSVILYALYQSPQNWFESIPRSLPLLDGILWFLLIGALRFRLRTRPAIAKTPDQLATTKGEGQNFQRCLIIGAGSAGSDLVRTLQRDGQGLEVVGFVDDDPHKQNLTIHRVPVLGNSTALPGITRDYLIDLVIIAIPSAGGDRLRELMDACRACGVAAKTLPSLGELLQSQAKAQTREIQLEDLLRREPIQTDLQGVRHLLAGKRVLVTGAGGSIGSELCRQIWQMQPSDLIVLGKGENSLFGISQELERRTQAASQGTTPNIHAFIADIRNRERLELLFRQYQPEVIFHAAAHKHVPLMELHPVEAITSNVLGTQNLVHLAQAYGVTQFVMISTDKAVNPTSIMGASKRLAEMLVLQAAKTTRQPYLAVRFGNVLGSRGSVVPTFRQQIAAGGPVTITHPEVRRYFMTIPEAVQLVLQASVQGNGGEVFMFDMGKPVKIIDLARDLIALSGYRVGTDIEITCTGLRPGEKLYEELFIPGEEYERTAHSKIIRVGNASRQLPPNLTTLVNQLAYAAQTNNFEQLRRLLLQTVAGYHPSPHNDHAPIKQLPAFSPSPFPKTLDAA
jgi:FlaA1/EpsC-like NDP-sugar epimerase